MGTHMYMYVSIYMYMYVVDMYCTLYTHHQPPVNNFLEIQYKTKRNICKNKLELEVRVYVCEVCVYMYHTVVRNYSTIIFLKNRFFLCSGKSKTVLYFYVSILSLMYV